MGWRLVFYVTTVVAGFVLTLFYVLHRHHPAFVAPGLLFTTLSAFAAGHGTSVYLDERWERKQRERRFILQGLQTEPLTGYELITRSGGMLDQGNVYPSLRDMEREGLVQSHEEPGGPERGHRPRRRYTITDTGREWLKWQ